MSQFSPGGNRFSPGMALPDHPNLARRREFLNRSENPQIPEPRNPEPQNLVTMTITPHHQTPSRRLDFLPQRKPAVYNSREVWTSFRQRHRGQLRPHSESTTLYDASTSSDLTLASGEEESSNEAASNDNRPLSSASMAGNSNFPPNRARSPPTSRPGSSSKQPTPPPGGPSGTLQTRMANAAEQAALRARLTTQF